MGCSSQDAVHITTIASPLMSSVETVRELQPVQVISFALLGFQNGFFWQTLFERLSTSIERGVGNRDLSLSDATGASFIGSSN